MHILWVPLEQAKTYHFDLSVQNLERPNLMSGYSFLNADYNSLRLLSINLIC